MIRTTDLAEKEVVTFRDGRNLGPISDIEVNLEEGRIEAIIVPAPGKLFSFFSRDSDYVIPWANIMNIGMDVILVELKDIIEPEREQGDI